MKRYLSSDVETERWNYLRVQVYDLSFVWIISGISLTHLEKYVWGDSRMRACEHVVSGPQKKKTEFYPKIVDFFRYIIIHWFSNSNSTSMTFLSFFLLYLFPFCFPPLFFSFLMQNHKILNGNLSQIIRQNPSTSRLKQLIVRYIKWLCNYVMSPRVFIEEKHPKFIEAICCHQEWW